MPVSKVHNTSRGLILSLGILRAVLLPRSRSARRSRWVLWGCMVWLSVTGGFPLAPGAAATTIVVTSLADPGTGGCTPADCTLREALAAAQDGETITFAPALFATGAGTITLTVGQLVIAHDVTIAGPGRRLLRISGNRASRVFWIHAGAVARIEKVRIMRGRADDDGLRDGGGLRNYGTLTLDHSMVSGNTARDGGGLSNYGTLTLRQSTVSGNTADSDGGGLSNYGTLTLRQSTVSGNTAGHYGGGLYNYSTLTLRQSTVSGNTAGYGGGIYSQDGTMALRSSTVSGNTARYYDGGGINNRVGPLTLDHSTVSGNTARDGGGLRNLGGPLTLYHSTVSGNTARRGSGGIHNHVGTVTLKHSTVSGNTARDGGRGIGNFGGTLTLSNTIVAGNMITATGNGPDCYRRTGTLRSRGHNLTGTATGCPSDASRGDLTIDPALVFTQVLGPLQDNGGSTFTHALLPGSLAIDVGEQARCRGTDQRGVPRPQGARCDIGAFELEQP